jgi:DNA uptake protein ComE-like DNA-binding protein
MLDSKRTANRSTNIYAAKSPTVKLWQLPAAALLVSLALLSGCNKKLPSSSPTADAAADSSATKPIATASKIDVNSASIAELDKLELPGTKPSLSERIQGKRPYKSADDLVAKKAISADELKLIKGLIIVGKAK